MVMLGQWYGVKTMSGLAPWYGHLRSRRISGRESNKRGRRENGFILVSKSPFILFLEPSSSRYAHTEGIT